MEKDETVLNKKTRIKSYFWKRCQISPVIEEDPRLISNRVKSNIIACAALVACTGGFSSTIYFPGLPAVTEELNAPPIATTLTAALFIFFMGAAPVVWAAISEYYHVRRFIFLVAMLIFIATSIGAAFVNNIWALVVVRCIQSIGVSSGQSVGAGYISDLYPIEERGSAFGKYMFGVILGPLLGPILGGFLIMSPLGWRSTFLFCFAFGILIFFITFFFIPETFRDDERFDKELPVPTTTTKQGRSNHNTVGPMMENESNQVNVVDAKRERKVFNPFAPFALLRHPFVLMPSVTAGFFFGAMFATQTILPLEFKTTYGLNSWQIGLSYLGAGIGNLTGSILGGKLSDRLLLRARRLRGGKKKVEDRFTINMWLAGLLFNPLGLLLFGWIVEYKKSIWGAIIGFGIQCFGNIQVVTTVTAYLVDSLPGHGAAATAVANFVRFGFACILTLVSTPMIDALGPGWTTALFACLSWLGMAIVFILKIRGEQIRKWSE